MHPERWCVGPADEIGVQKSVYLPHIDLRDELGPGGSDPNGREVFRTGISIGLPKRLMLATICCSLCWPRSVVLFVRRESSRRLQVDYEGTAAGFPCAPAEQSAQ